MKLKFYLALWAAKASVIALKVTKHNGTDFPGNLALKICPDFAKHIDKPKTIIGITGTNGKTTTTNLIADLLEQDGRAFLCNRLGSNCFSGILTCLISGVSLFGRSQYDTAVLEMDERSSRLIYPNIQPDYLVINNLTRDSIMRNGHPEYISWILSQFMPQKTKLIINGDDLISVGVSPENDRCYFGIDRMATDLDQGVNLLNDMQICPKCHTKMVYDYVRYHHIGRAHCPNCGYANPEYTYGGHDVDLNSKTMQITAKGQTETFPLLTNGIHDMYNVTAAVSVLQELGYTLPAVAELMKHIKVVASRFDATEPKPGYRVIRQMSKDVNAVATTRAFDHISKQLGKKELILIIFNGGDACWSENICWMQDCDFEFLNHPDITNIICTGPRWADYVLRLKMAGVPEDRITVIEEKEDAPKGLRLTEPEDIYVLYGTDAIPLSERVAAKACEEVMKRTQD